MAKVLVLKSFYVNGEIKTSQYIANVKDVRLFFDNAIFDAGFLSKTLKGKIHVQRTENTLCINYRDVIHNGLIEVKRIVL